MTRSATTHFGNTACITFTQYTIDVSCVLYSYIILASIHLCFLLFFSVCPAIIYFLMSQETGLLQQKGEGRVRNKEINAKITVTPFY